MNPSALAGTYRAAVDVSPTSHAVSMVPAPTASTTAPAPNFEINLLRLIKDRG
jgi:hypothetical protein